jgi:hypothetical protein
MSQFKIERRMKREQVNGRLRKVHNEELHIMGSSSNIITGIKSKIMRQADMYLLSGK